MEECVSTRSGLETGVRILMETLSPYGENKRALKLSVHHLVEVVDGQKRKYFIVGKDNKVKAKLKTLRELLDHFA